MLINRNYIFTKYYLNVILIMIDCNILLLDILCKNTQLFKYKLQYNIDKIQPRCECDSLNRVNHFHIA